jgi:hypothetical protein
MPLNMKGIDPVANVVAPVPPWSMRHGVISHLNTCVSVPDLTICICIVVEPVVVDRIWLAAVSPSRLFIAANAADGAKNNSADAIDTKKFFIILLLDLIKSPSGVGSAICPDLKNK